MNNKFIFLVLGILLISFTSALEFDNIIKTPIIEKGASLLIGDKLVEYTNIWENYKPIEINNLFGFGETLFSGAITQHDASCGINCKSTMELYLANDGVLIDDIIFKTLQDDGSWIKQDVRNYQFSYLNKSEWIKYNIKEELKAGTYTLKLDAQKKPSRTVDWIITTQGKVLNEWAVFNGIPTIYDELNDSSINMSLWTLTEYESNPTNIRADIIEDSNAIGLGATLLVSTSASANEKVVSNNLPNINNIVNYIIRVGVGVNEDGQTTGTAYFKAFGNTIKSITTETSDDSVWWFIKNGTSQFDVYNDGAYINTITIAANTFEIYASQVYASSSSYSVGWASIYYVYYNNSNIFLNFPIDNYISPTNLVTFNATATVTGGATLTNMSLWTNETSWSSKNTTTVTGTTNTSTWINTLVDGQSYLWNVQACDSDGDCGFATSNRTLFIDATPPIITGISGDGVNNYGSISINHTINFTVTDTNLDDCWINYNNTNRTVSCSSGVQTSVNFSLVNGLYNAIIYANDSVGNLKTQPISWSYLIFENSQTYPITAVESATETYTANLTYNSSAFNIISGILNFNGTGYIGAKTGTTIFTANAIMPNIAVETNLTAYWTISLTNVTGTYNYNLTSHNVTVSIINLSLCDATNNVAFWNFTILNESNAAEINSTFEATFTVKSTGSTTENIFSYSNTNGNKSQYDFCISPSTKSYTINTNIKLTKNGYVDKFYNYGSVIVTNATREDNLYMMITGDSTSFIVHTVYASGEDLINAEVKVQRYYPGTNQWLTTEILTTNDEGEAIGHFLSEDADYRFQVYLVGVSIYNSSSTKIVCATAPCTVTLIIPSSFLTGYETHENLDTTLTYNPTTNTFTYTYSDTGTTFDSARLWVTRISPSNATIVSPCNESKLTASGVITCDITGQVNGTYRAVGYITRDDSEFVSKIIYGSIGTNFYSNIGEDGILWGFFLLIAITMLGIARPSMAIVFGILSLIFVSLLGIVNIGIVSIVAVISIGIILLMRVGRE